MSDTPIDTARRPQGWAPSSAYDKPGHECRYRVELSKRTARDRVTLFRAAYADEGEALAAFWGLARPARVRARVVATVTQIWVSPPADESGVQFETWRSWADAYASREVP